MIQASTRHLNRKNNTVRSCGCLKLVRGKDHKDWKGYEGISAGWWSQHVGREHSQKYRARVELTITMKYAWGLLVSQNFKCKLSGVPLEIRRENGTASLDRIDSSLGYIPGNVQWAHKHVNFMKRTYSQEYFIEMCKLIAENNKNE